MVSAIQIINALSSGKSLVVFDLIAVEGGDKKSIINSLGPSPKQYNSAISALRKSGSYFVWRSDTRGSAANQIGYQGLLAA